MSANDVLRFVWTFGTGIGTIAMIVLWREVWLDAQAVKQVRRPGTDVLRMYTQGEVMDQGVRLVAVAALFIAGVASYLGLTTIALAMLVCSAGATVFLGTLKLHHRRRIMRTLRLNRVAK